jgi:hypothetical protein
MEDTLTELTALKTSYLSDINEREQTIARLQGDVKQLETQFMIVTQSNGSEIFFGENRWTSHRGKEGLLELSAQEDGLGTLYCGTEVYYISS